MRIISWNIQQGGGKRVPGITRCLERWDPDIAVLGEVRGTAPSGHIAGFLADTGLMNQLHTVDHAQATRNSLLIASRFSLAPRDRAGEIPDPHRWLAVDVHADQPFTLIGMHVPNRSSGKKFDFHDAVVRELGLPNRRGIPARPGLRHCRDG